MSTFQKWAALSSHGFGRKRLTTKTSRRALLMRPLVARTQASNVLQRSAARLPKLTLLRKHRPGSWRARAAAAATLQRLSWGWQQLLQKAPIQALPPQRSRRWLPSRSQTHAQARRVQGALTEPGRLRAQGTWEILGPAWIMKWRLHRSQTMSVLRLTNASGYLRPLSPASMRSATPVRRSQRSKRRWRRQRRWRVPLTLEGCGSPATVRSVRCWSWSASASRSPSLTTARSNGKCR
mmetsp:Transcript_5595/g.16980  ORF Transcript_5595/g.16980 Transcript_5595/m.16980 type:complete len:237 (+) Transcript_5595:1353-2063(+)